jgi:hypothetical protein
MQDGVDKLRSLLDSTDYLKALDAETIKLAPTGTVQGAGGT